MGNRPSKDGKRKNPRKSKSASAAKEAGASPKHVRGQAPVPPPPQYQDDAGQGYFEEKSRFRCKGGGRKSKYPSKKDGSASFEGERGGRAKVV